MENYVLYWKRLAYWKHGAVCPDVTVPSRQPGR